MRVEGSKITKLKYNESRIHDTYLKGFDNITKSRNYRNKYSNVYLDQMKAVQVRKLKVKPAVFICDLNIDFTYSSAT